ncbi:hypothetical protein XA68_13302 [Ophiocordyceps unilateralis]|uniref:Vacuolar protein sorting-associated protein 62 n=1 Tax=Ophiocordyceps unilateralis TaxID=268505 RepID=A0A2A9PCV6_OPHUN|nr:hypothetical protein XA68_13302 [Ophiocordyceps unilateralis]
MVGLKRWLRRCLVLLTLLATFCFLAWFLPRALNPTETSPEKRLEDRLWIDTSPYFLDRQACRWLSLCGLHHLRADPAVGPDEGAVLVDYDEQEWRELRRRTVNNDDDKRSRRTVRRRIVKDVPSFVTRYAPYVHLYSGEQFWPSDIGQHLRHMNATDHHGNPLHDGLDSITLDRLDHLGGRHVTLHSRDDVETRPAWLYSRDNMPEGRGDDDDDNNHHHHQHPVPPLEHTTWFDADRTHPPHRLARPPVRSQRSRPKTPTPPVDLYRRGHKPDQDGYSGAPAILVVVDKGAGILDAFWFFFYSYNLGQTVLGLRFGNHVGDWEHCMVRFQHGIPRGLYLSEHEGGQAYAWSAVEKTADGRPVVYSALGSHAMYALAGDHPYVLPLGLLKDVTDKGPRWDPAKNMLAYHYDYVRPDDGLAPAAANPDAPTSWFHFRGRWGDAVYALADARQWRLFDEEEEDEEEEDEEDEEEEEDDDDECQSEEEEETGRKRRLGRLSEMGTRPSLTLAIIIFIFILILILILVLIIIFTIIIIIIAHAHTHTIHPSASQLAS